MLLLQSTFSHLLKLQRSTVEVITASRTKHIQDKYNSQEMALRSLGRVGVDVGSRVACTSRRRAATHSCSSMSSARAVSSLVGPGQGHFGRSRAPPCTPGEYCWHQRKHMCIRAFNIVRDLLTLVRRPVIFLPNYTVFFVVASFHGDFGLPFCPVGPMSPDH